MLRGLCLTCHAWSMGLGLPPIKEVSSLALQPLPAPDGACGGRWGRGQLSSIKWRAVGLGRAIASSNACSRRGRLSVGWGHSRQVGWQAVATHGHGHGHGPHSGKFLGAVGPSCYLAQCSCSMATDSTVLVHLPCVGGVMNQVD
jgi:hypothetical protein